MVDKTGNVLVTGSSGYLGSYVLNELLKIKNDKIYGGKIFAVYNDHPINFPQIEPIKCDLSDKEDVAGIFSDTKPDVVIHLASGTPTRIEGQGEDIVREINVNSTEHIAKLCASYNSLMIFTSSDLVYENGIDLKEDSSLLKPLTIYAKTKLDGESAVRQNADRFIIFRMALVYGFTQSSYESFFDTSYSTLSAGKQMRAFTDQYRNAVYVEDAAAIIAGTATAYKNNDTINLGGKEYLSRFDMCMLMAGMYGFKRNLIIPASIDEFTLYPTVKQLGLNCGKLMKLGFRTLSYRQNLLRAMNHKPAA